MLNRIFTFVVFATSPVFTAMFKERQNTCSSAEFACGDDSCLGLDVVCDGHRDCADGSDEAYCFGDQFPLGKPVLNRMKRQSTCRKSQWRCRDGTCIGFDGKCDGIVDCPDGSDETHPLCRGSVCQTNWFRCTYGACVDGTAPCNSVKDCADNSDELQPQCFNETLEVRGQYKCRNGNFISAANRCDGMRDCADGSDEDVRACASKRCPSYLFQCAYGACVDQGADCNGKTECADGSDESDELCNRALSGTTTTSTTTRPSNTGACEIPSYPEHGRYVLADGITAVPGQRFDSVNINVTCNPGYGVNGVNQAYCFYGIWSPLPECIRFCRVIRHPSVEYRCLLTGSGSIEGTRDCNDIEPDGTTIRPECKKPNYYYAGFLPYMHCVNGNWDSRVTCTAECGRVTPEGEQLIINGRRAKRGELPWHAGIYKKTEAKYNQICGGSIITNTVVISAAHCFWDQSLEPPSLFGVAVGKLYRPWNDPHDEGAQSSDVSAIKVPKRFQGAAANFQDDIAIVVVSIAFEYKTYIRPVCVDFDYGFDSRQLQPGKMGKVAGWGFTTVHGKASPVLKVVDLPYVDIDECISESPPNFREYITSDKVCAGFRNGTALCKGDSGGGLAFPDTDRGIERYYLRGIVSTSPNNENLCNDRTVTTFTQIIKHDNFIKEWLHL